MPSLVGILGRRVAPPVVTQVVMAAVAGMATESARSRLASRWAAAEQEVVDQPVTAARPAATVQPQAMLSDATDEAFADTLSADLLPAAGAIAAPVDAPVPVEPVATPVEAKPLSATLADVLNASDIPPVSLADILAARPAASITAPAAIAQAAPAPAAPAVAARPATTPAAPVTRSSRPSPDSPLARVLAAGHRAFARSQQAATTPDVATDETAPVATRPATLPGWLTQPRAAMSPAPLPAVVPATTVPRHLPARPTERRLHLA